MNRSGLRAGWVVLAALLAMVLWPCWARAQEGPLDEAGPLGMPVTMRTVRATGKVLGFDKEQNEQARMLYQGYRAAFRAATAKARKAGEESNKKATESGDWESYHSEQKTRTIAYVEEVAKLEKEFWSDVGAFCTVEQMELLPRAERMRRRESGRFFTLSSGAGIDLIEVFDELKIDWRADTGMRELVERWELDADRVFTEKEKLFQEGMRTMMGGGENMEAGMKFFADLQAVSGRIADVNKRAAREAEGLVPEPRRAEFATAITMKTYPRIYAPTRTARLLGAAEKSKGLSEDQRVQLAAIRESYEREAAGLNARWAATADEKQRMNLEELQQVMMGGEDPEDPFFAARAKRHELDERFAERILALLTEEQKSALPQEDEEEGSEIPEFLPDFERDFETKWEELEEEEE